MGPFKKASLAAASQILNSPKSLHAFIKFLDHSKSALVMMPKITLNELYDSLIEKEYDRATLAISRKDYLLAHEYYSRIIELYEKGRYLSQSQDKTKKLLAEVYFRRGKLQQDKEAALIDYDKSFELNLHNKAAKQSREAIVLGRGQLEGTDYADYKYDFSESDKVQAEEDEAYLKYQQAKTSKFETNESHELK
ncbi:MAG: hypothetical protein Q7V63_04370 [Gammaproteobacteria bacterium]|nr:hypothetical protein [Gammaproteobacteria bacterium]